MVVDHCRNAAVQVQEAFQRGAVDRSRWVIHNDPKPTVAAEPRRLFEALAGQRQLMRLSVKWGDFEDLSALSELAHLSYLRLGGASNVRDLRPLSGLSAVAELELESLRHARDLGPIGAMSGVTSLAVGGAVWSLRIAHVDSIAFLREMPQLRRLWLEAVIVDDLEYSPVLEVPSLQNVWVMKARGMRPAYEDLVASTPWDARD